MQNYKDITENVAYLPERLSENNKLSLRIFTAYMNETA